MVDLTRDPYGMDDDKPPIPSKLVACPFCGEDDFDLPGLKMHLESGWCEVYLRVEAEG